MIGVAVVSILVGFSALAFVVTNREPNTSGLTSEQLELFTTLRQDSVAAQKGYTRYKVLWIGEIAKHKGIGETKVLQGKKKAKVLWIYWLP